MSVRQNEKNEKNEKDKHYSCVKKKKLQKDWKNQLKIMTNAFIKYLPIHPNNNKPHEQCSLFN